MLGQVQGQSIMTQKVWMYFPDEHFPTNIYFGDVLFKKTDYLLKEEDCLPKGQVRISLNPQIVGISTSQAMGLTSLARKC